MHQKDYLSSPSEISDLRSAESEISGPRAEIFCHRPIRLALRLALLVIFAASRADGTTNPSDPKPDRGASRASIVSKSPSVEPAASALFNYKWNVDDRQFPLLSFFSEQLKPGLDQSLSYPMDQFRFLIFETLDYDDARVRYFLPSISSDGRGTHLIEFEPTQIKNNFVSVDEKKLKLTDNGAQKTIRASDGTRYVFVRYPDGEFRCAEIKDAGNNRLNFVYTSNGSMLHGVVDSAGRTITFNYADDGIGSVTQTWMANATGVQKTWIVGDPSAGASFPSNYSRAPGFTSSKRVPANALVQHYTAEMEASDRTLAQIFGGPNAVAAGNGFEPAGLAASYPLYRGDIIGDDGKLRRGHLSYAIHLYGNSRGTGDSPLYIPNGFTMHSPQPSPTDAAVTFYYPKLGNLTDITLAVFHIANFEVRAEGDRVRIGNIAGMGGSSPLYKHSHIEFYRGNTGLPPADARMRLRIDPAAVFAGIMQPESSTFKVAGFSPIPN
jgi:hypothetical protein